VQRIVVLNDRVLVICVCASGPVHVDDVLDCREGLVNVTWRAFVIGAEMDEGGDEEEEDEEEDEEAEEEDESELSDSDETTRFFFFFFVGLVFGLVLVLPFSLSFKILFAPSISPASARCVARLTVVTGDAGTGKFLWGGC